MTTLSVVLIVKNEEKKLKRCLDSVRSVANEIVVVDTGSEDKTIDIAKHCGAKVFSYKWQNDFSKARNFALSKAAGDWILSLDADEYLEGNYKSEITKWINGKQCVGRLKITSSFVDDGQIRETTTFISRLFPKGVVYEGRIHEQIQTILPRFNTTIEIKHDGYFETDKTARNIELLELELIDHPNDGYYIFQMGKEYRHRKDFQRAVSYFKKSYEGLTKEESYAREVILEYLNACIKGKALEDAKYLIENEQNFLADSPDFHFAVGVFYMEYLMNNLTDDNIKSLSLIEHAYKRCLEIGETSQYESVKGTGSFLAAYNLGVYYEVTGQIVHARHFYQRSANDGFELAKSRLKLL